VTLEEIQAKADELLTQVLGEDHSSRAEHAARKLRCLELAARIKSIVAFSNKREDDLARMRDLPRHQPLIQYPAAPTKPAADRLHELVSYFIQQSQQAFNATRVEPAEQHSRYLSVSKAYDDAATKLDEILREGSL
jgi:hypothetical protein